MRVPPEPGEWKREPGPFGKRYRMVGNTKEYEMLITVDGGLQIPESELEDYHRRKKEAEQAARDAATPPRKNCPFSDRMDTTCTGEACALYLDGCTLARLTDRPPAKATEGLKCPLSTYHNACRRDCALYKEGGCTLTGIDTTR